MMYSDLPKKQLKQNPELDKKKEWTSKCDFEIGIQSMVKANFVKLTNVFLHTLQIKLGIMKQL